MIWRDRNLKFGPNYDLEEDNLEKKLKIWRGAAESHASAWLNHLRSSVVKIKFSVTCLFDLNGQPFNKKLNIFNLNDFPPPLTNMSQISWACCSGMRINLNFLIGFSN